MDPKQLRKKLNIPVAQIPYKSQVKVEGIILRDQQEPAK
jgi:hypothetical protein